MAFSRIESILILGLSALLLRALPQLFLVGKKFPETWDRLLRYLSYALLCGLISITLPPVIRSPVHSVLSPKQSSFTTCLAFVVDCSV